jgi:uncharacterized RDD family membrane protein YckC
VKNFLSRLLFDAPTLGRRTVAGITDSLLLLVVLLGVLRLPLTLLIADQGVRKDAALAVLLLWLVPFIPAYYIVFEAMVGATPGKLLLGLRVEKLDGRRFSLAAAVIRNLVRYADAMPFGWYFVAAILITLTPRRQRLGDLVAGTSVRQWAGWNALALVSPVLLAVIAWFLFTTDWSAENGHLVQPIAESRPIGNTCPEGTVEICHFSLEIEDALTDANVEVFVKNTQFQAVTCPIPESWDYTEPCEEPDGTAVGRVSQPQLFIYGGHAGGHGNSISVKSYRDLLTLLFAVVLPDESDDVGRGAFRLFALSRKPGDEGSRLILITAILKRGGFGICESSPCRLLVEFAAYPLDDGGWAFRSMTTVGPDPDVLSVWFEETDANSWVLWP